MKTDGTPCNAQAVEGSRFCYHHDPKLFEEAQKARAKGSRKAAAMVRAQKDGKAEKEPLKTFRLNTLDDVRRLLASTINDLRTRKLSTDEARCTAYVANILLSAIKDCDIETRLKKLEERVKEHKEDQWAT